MTTAITRNLKNRLYRPGTTMPLTGHRVSIRLNTPGFIDDGTVSGTQTTEQADDLYVWTDDTGLWVAPLVPNVYINPDGSWYSIKEFKNSPAWTAIVPDGGADSDVWLETTLVPGPTNPTPIVVEYVYPARVVTLTVSGSTYPPNSDTTDEALIITPSGGFTVATPTGTPGDGQRLIIRIRSGATGFTPTWGAGYESSGVAPLPSGPLPNSKTVTFGFIYDASAAKWVLLASDPTGY